MQKNTQNIKLKGWGNQQFGANGSLEKIVGQNKWLFRANSRLDKKEVGENSRTEKIGSWSKYQDGANSWLLQIIGYSKQLVGAKSWLDQIIG